LFSKIFLQFAPASPFAVLLVIHFTLLSFVFEREIIKFLVERVHRLITDQLELVVLAIIGLLLWLVGQSWDHSLIIDVDLVAVVSPFGGHELLVLGLVVALGCVRLVLSGLT